MVHLKSEMLQLPSFSIILETENLANAEIDNLSASLNSLANQDIAITLANEVLIIDSGDAPPEILKQVCTTYSWIKIKQVQAGADYYDAKMHGVGLATGDIVVYADSDCVYEANWLRSIITPFCDPNINIVAGETSLSIQGPYDLAMAITYFLPRFSNQETLYASNYYFLNNVAFRRNFLIEHPIPTGLPLYRGNCGIHACYLRTTGHQIWKQPQARATHAPPEGLSFFFWRFLLMGRDHLLMIHLRDSLPLSGSTAVSPKQLSSKQQIRKFAQWLNRESNLLSAKAKTVMSEKPRRLVFIPVALPFILASKFLVYIGGIITFFESDYLLTRYHKSQT